MTDQITTLVESPYYGVFYLFREKEDAPAERIGIFASVGKGAYIEIGTRLKEMAEIGLNNASKDSQLTEDDLIEYALGVLSICREGKPEHLAVPDGFKERDSLLDICDDAMSTCVHEEGMS